MSDPAVVLRAILKKGREEPVKRMHPWIFSGAIAFWDGDPVDGDRVLVCDHAKNLLGWGHYHDGSIRIKLLQFGNQKPNDQVFRSAIQEAWALRKALGIGPGTETTGFRLIHGEGDGLPGLIVDIYDRVAVLQAHTIGMHRELNLISEVVRDLPGLPLIAVYDKSARTLPPIYAQTMKEGYLWGATEEGMAFKENGLTFLAAWEQGQKTGFFLDQRENRVLLSRYAKGKSVLNTFCYTGGFSLYALAAKASRVISVDVSAKAMLLLDQHVSLNNYTEAGHESHIVEVIPFLKQMEEKMDIVILDPPAFAKSINKRHQAVQGYKRLNAEGMARVNEGGLLFTFSCSQVVDAVLFRDTVLAAALEAGKRVRILHVLSQGPDHPVSLALPESSYLKGLVLEIRDV